MFVAACHHIAVRIFVADGFEIVHDVAHRHFDLPIGPSQRGSVVIQIGKIATLFYEQVFPWLADPGRVHV